MNVKNIKSGFLLSFRRRLNCFLNTSYIVQQLRKEDFAVVLCTKERVDGVFSVTCLTQFGILETLFWNEAFFPKDDFGVLKRK